MTPVNPLKFRFTDLPKLLKNGIWYLIYWYEKSFRKLCSFLIINDWNEWNHLKRMLNLFLNSVKKNWKKKNSEKFTNIFFWHLFFRFQIVLKRMLKKILPSALFEVGICRSLTRINPNKWRYSPWRRRGKGRSAPAWRIACAAGCPSRAGCRLNKNNHNNII